MVAGVDHQRVITQARLIQRRQHLAHLLVHEGDQAAVTGDGPPHILLAVEVAAVIDHPCVLVGVRVVRPYCGVIKFGHRQVQGRIVLIPGRGRRQRKVRRDHGDKKHPGLVVGLLSPLLQPGAGGIANLAVIAGVGGFARASQLGHLVAATPHRNVAAHQSLDVADTIDHVHGQDFFGPAMVIAGLAPEMQFANGRGPVAGLAQRMVPTRNAAVVGVGVVPKTDLMHIAAGGKGGAGRHANGAAGVGLAEAGAPAGQAV